MCCFTINLSFSLLAKEFLKLVNIWQSCGQDYGVFFFIIIIITLLINTVDKTQP